MNNFPSDNMMPNNISLLLILLIIPSGESITMNKRICKHKSSELLILCYNMNAQVYKFEINSTHATFS